MLTTIIATTNASSGVQTLIDAMGDVVSLGGTVLNAMLAQPILVFFAATSLIGVGVGVIHKLRAAL